MSRTTNRNLTVAIVALLLIGVASSRLYQEARSWLDAPIAELKVATVFEVPHGTGWKGVLNDLQTRGLLTHSRELATWIRYMRPGYALKAGEYELKPGLSPAELLDLFNSGRVLMHSLTIVEGSTFAELRRMIASNSAIKNTASALTNSELMRRLGVSDPPEGFFFPDTYLFAKGASDLELLQVARRRMQTELDRAWASRDPSLSLANAYEALILASIVEKETALASERPIIAGVFLERLQRGMRLQTDPTVIYGLGEKYHGNIHSADLRTDTPYNTYTRTGLPPTPICLPGAAALNAAVHPERSGALFFVATGNSDGGHYFSKTLEEHNAAVQRYLKALRQRS